MASEPTAEAMAAARRIQLCFVVVPMVGAEAKIARTIDEQTGMPAMREALEAIAFELPRNPKTPRKARIQRLIDAALAVGKG